MRELETWLHARERGASTAAGNGSGNGNRQHDWRRRRLAILRYSRALLDALLRDVEL